MTTQSLFASLADVETGVYAVSSDQTILFWNRGAEQILGMGLDEAVGRKCYEVVQGVVPGGITPECRQGCPSRRLLREGRMPQATRLWMRCASGERKLVSVTPVVVGGSRQEPAVVMHLFVETPGGAEDGGAQGSYSGRYGEGGTLPTANPPARERALTAREIEVLQLVALGWSTPRIAEHLEVSLHTVLNHIRHFRGKLDASTKLEAVVTAIRLGILPSP